MTTRSMVAMALVCSLAVALTGCKSWRSKKNTTTPGGDNGGLVTDGTTLGGNTGGLAPRPGEGMTPVAGQFDTVLFAFDSAAVDEGERAKVEKIAEFMKSSPAAMVVCEGHCDERGSNEYNMSLGERRALAVRDYLMNLGIDGARIQTKSFGEERPKDPGHTEDAWRVNRRVEFVVLKG